MTGHFKINLTKQQKRQIITIMTVMIFLGMAATDIYVPSLPLMMKDLATSTAKMNLTLSCYTFGIAISVLFVGEFSNRYGRRWLLIGAASGFSLSSLVIANTYSLSIIIICRIIQSVCAGTSIIMARLVIKDTMNQIERLRAMGMVLLGIILSPAIAPVIGAYLTRYFGWRSTFWFIFLISTILLVSIIKFIPETNTNLLKKFNSPKHYLYIYWSLLTNKAFVSNVLIASTTTGPLFAFLGISSYLFILHWHFTPEHYSYLYFLISGAYLFGNIIMQTLNKHNFSLDRIIKHGMSFSIIGIILMVISILFKVNYTIILVITAMVLMRAANALIAPTTQIKILNRFSNYSAQAIGLSFCINFMFNSLAITGVTFFSHKPLLGLITVSTTFILIAVFCFIYTLKTSVISL